MNDYEIPSNRKSKKDKKMKRMYNIYKKGGKRRSENKK